MFFARPEIHRKFYSHNSKRYNFNIETTYQREEQEKKRQWKSKRHTPVINRLSNFILVADEKYGKQPPQYRNKLDHQKSFHEKKKKTDSAP